LLLFSGICIQGFSQASTKELQLGNDVSLELVYIKPGKFKMGSSLEEKIWATGWEGGAQPGKGLPGTGTRESYEGEQLRRV